MYQGHGGGGYTEEHLAITLTLNSDTIPEMYIIAFIQTVPRLPRMLLNQFEVVASISSSNLRGFRAL